MIVSIYLVGSIYLYKFGQNKAQPRKFLIIRHMGSMMSSSMLVARLYLWQLGRVSLFITAQLKS